MSEIKPNEKILDKMDLLDKSDKKKIVEDVKGQIKTVQELRAQGKEEEWKKIVFGRTNKLFVISLREKDEKKRQEARGSNLLLLDAWIKMNLRSAPKSRKKNAQ